MVRIRGIYMLPKYDELVKTIKSERKRLGLSQRDLAKKAGVSKSLIGKLETKMHTPNYKNIRKIWRTIDKAREGEDRTAQEFVQKNIVSVKPSDTVGKVADIMKKNDFSQLPVEEDGEYIGIITSTQLIDMKHRDALVGRSGYRDLPMIPHDTPKDDFSPLLRSNPALLVTKDDEVIGIITPADLL